MPFSIARAINLIRRPAKIFPFGPDGRPLILVAHALDFGGHSLGIRICTVHGTILTQPYISTIEFCSTQGLRPPSIQQSRTSRQALSSLVTMGLWVPLDDLHDLQIACLIHFTWWTKHSNLNQNAGLILAIWNKDPPPAAQFQTRWGSSTQRHDLVEGLSLVPVARELQTSLQWYVTLRRLNLYSALKPAAKRAAGEGSHSTQRTDIHGGQQGLCREKISAQCLTDSKST
jgi:hypothetical protein